MQELRLFLVICCEELIGEDPDAGKDWKQEEKGTTEDEMVGWHHQLDGHEFEQAPGVGDQHGGLACCSPWGRKKSDIVEWLNWTETQMLTPRPYSVYGSGSLLKCCSAVFVSFSWITLNDYQPYGSTAQWPLKAHHYSGSRSAYLSVHEK